MTTQVSPSILQANGVPVYKMTQEERTFIVTFPKCFHAGFSYGVSAVFSHIFSAPKRVLT